MVFGIAWEQVPSCIKNIEEYFVLHGKNNCSYFLFYRIHEIKKVLGVSKFNRVLNPWCRYGETIYFFVI